MEFVVYEDKRDATDTKIHVADCHYYINRKRDAPTTKWHGPYATYDQACIIAEGIAKNKRHPFANSKDPKCHKLLSKMKRGKVGKGA